MQDAIAAAMKTDFFFFLWKDIINNESLCVLLVIKPLLALSSRIALELQRFTLQKTVKEWILTNLHSVSVGKFWRIRHIDVFSGKNF